jgi:hypothetical protein
MDIKSIQNLIIDGIEIAEQALVTWSLQSILSKNSGYTLDGTYHEDRVAEKVELTYEWPQISMQQKRKIVQTLASKPIHDITYFDVLANAQRTSKFRVSDPVIPIIYSSASNFSLTFNEN